MTQITSHDYIYLLHKKCDSLKLKVNIQWVNIITIYDLSLDLNHFNVACNVTNSPQSIPLYSKSPFH